MGQIDPLYKLILSLDPVTKQGFRRYCESLANPKELQETAYWILYQKILREIKKGGNYDEDKLRKAFADQSNFSNLKAILYNRIIESLVSSTSHPRSLLEKELAGIRELILIGQGNEKKTTSRIEKLISQSTQFEYFEITLLCFDVRTKIWADQERDDLIKGELPRQQMEAITLAHHQNTISLYKTLYNTYYLTFKEYYTARGHLEKVMIEPLENHPLLQMEGQPETVTASLFFFQLKYLVALFNGQFDQAYEQVKNVVKTFETNPHLIQEYPAMYVDSIANLGTCLSQIGRQKEAEKELDRLTKIQTRSMRVKARIWKGTVVMRLAQYVDAGDKAKAMALHKKFQAGMQEFGPDLRKEDWYFASWKILAM